MREHNSEYQVMNKLALGLALSAALVSAPALAKSDAAKRKNTETMSQSEMLKTPGQNREPGDNGTYQGKPVVEGPAHWPKVISDNASSGSSTGEAGSAGKSATHN